MELPTAVDTSAQPPKRYDPPHVLWYFGAVAAVLSASAMVASTSSSHRGIWQLLIGLIVMALFAGLSLALLRAGWKAPGGVLAAAAVALVPAVGQAFERLIGVWPNVSTDPASLVADFQGSFFALGVATLLAGIGAFALVKFPFVFAPATIAVLLSGQFLVPAFGEGQAIEPHATTMLITGAALFVVGLVLDAVGRAADGFWWHATGLFGIAVGLTWYAELKREDWAWVAILILAGVLILASAPFRRATWTSFGALGVFGATLHYVNEWFGSWKSPAVMIVVSLGLIALGMLVHLNTQLWAAKFHRPAAPAAQATAPPEPEEAVVEPVAPEAPVADDLSADEPPAPPS